MGMQDKNKILGVDLGEKRIGLAISDTLGILAHPYKTVPWQGIKKLINDLQEIIKSEHIVQIVVGIPYTMQGTHSQKTDSMLHIVDQLKESMKIPIITVDERLTTKMAHQALHAVGKKPSKQRDKVDQIAAVFILQSYLDGQ